MLEANADGTLAGARTANMQSSLGLPDRYTVLHAASYAGNAKVVKYLLSPCHCHCHKAGCGSSPRDNLGIGGTWMRWMCREGQRWSRTAAPVGGFQDERLVD
jgi:hypothetical protein